MTVISMLFLLAPLAYTALAVAIWQQNPRGRLNLNCTVVLASLCAWSLSGIFLNMPALPVEQAHIVMNVAAFGWCSFPTVYLAFVLALVGRMPRRFGRLLDVGFLLAPAVFIFQQFAGNMTTGFVQRHDGWTAIWSSSAWPTLFHIHFVACVATGVLLLLTERSRRAHADERRAFDVLLASSLLAVALAALINLLLPRLIPGRGTELSSISGLVWAAGIYYVLRRGSIRTLTPRTAAADILSAMGDAVMLVDPDGLVVAGNSALAELHDRQIHELVGRKAASLFVHPDVFEETLRELSATGRTTTTQLECRRQDADSVPVSASARVVRPGRRAATGTVWVLHDVTDRRRAERDLRESEGRYRSFVEHFQGIAFRGRLDYTIEFLHGAVKEVTGYDAKDFLSGTVRWRAMIHPDDVEYLRTGTARLRSEPGLSLVREYRIIRKDGSIAWLREAASNLSDESGRPARLHGTLFDITGEKKLLDEISRLSQFRESILDNASVWVVVADRDMNVLVWNRAAEEISGYRREEVIGNSGVWERMFPDPVYRRLMDDRGRNLIQEAGTAELLTEVTTSGGGVRAIAWSIRPVVGPAGTIDATIGIGREVDGGDARAGNTHTLSLTALELAELPAEADVFRFVAERLRSLAAASLVFVNEFDPASSTLTLRAMAGAESHAPALQRLLGRDPSGICIPIAGEAVAKLTSSRLTAVPGGLRQLAQDVIPDVVCQAIQQLFGADEAWSIGFSWQDQLYGNASLLMPSGHHVAAPELIEAFIRQATIALRRRRAETALLASEANFRAMSENASDGIAVLNEEGIYLYANHRASELLGAPLDRVIGSSFTEWVRPEDVAMLEERTKRLLSGEPVSSISLTGVRPDGTITRVEVAGSVTTWQGAPAVLVLVRDVRTRADG